MKPFDLQHRVPVEDPLKLWVRGLAKLKRMWVSMTYPFASRGRNCEIHHTCDLRRQTAHRIMLGNRVGLAKDVRIRVCAPPEETGGPVIVIEDCCGIGPWSMISARNSIHLERDVITGPSVLLMDHSQPYEGIPLQVKTQPVAEGGKIRIGQGSWIGHGAAIVCTQGELVLGRNCIVAANALVTRSFPPYCVISGNPARIVKQFDPVKKVWVLGYRSRE